MRSTGRKPIVWFAVMGLTPLLALSLGWEAFFTVALVSLVGGLLCIMQMLAAKTVIEQITEDLVYREQQTAKTPARVRRRIVILERVALIGCSALLLVILFGSTRNPLSPSWNEFLLISDTKGFPHLGGVSLANPHMRAGVFGLIELIGGDVEFLPPAGWNRSPTIKANVSRVTDDISRFRISHNEKAAESWQKSHW